jgi:hypothetical protein
MFIVELLLDYTASEGSEEIHENSSVRLADVEAEVRTVNLGAQVRELPLDQPVR